MNDQCAKCKKFCYESEPEEDWTCKHFKLGDDYDYLFLPIKHKRDGRYKLTFIKVPHHPNH